MSTYGQLVQFGPFFSGGLLCTIKVYHYIVGTTTLKDVYTDREKTTPAAQPVVSDANGIVSFYGDGLYKFRIDGATDGVTYSTLYTYDKWAVGDQILQVQGEGAALTSAATLVLGTDGNFFHVTGTSGPIAALSGSLTEVTLVFDSTPTLSHSGNLILRDAASYTVTAGDVFMFVFDGAGVWRETSRSSVTTPTKTYVDNYHQQTTASYVSTDTLAANVDLALLSGASFVFTLPAAASFSGRNVTILHQGTSLTQVYTVKGNASENIIAQDGTANTYLLYTNGEEITIKSNGTGWQVRGHLAKTDWVDAGVTVITGTTSDPTKATTPDYDHVFWRRDGKTAHVKWIFQVSNGAGAADGSGNYLFATPTGIAIDAILPPVGTAYATAVMSEALRSGVFGLGQVVIDSSAKDNVLPFAYDTTHLQWSRDSNASAISASAYEMTNDEFGYYLEAHFPAANWRT